MSTVATADMRLLLGLDAADTLLLALTVAVSVLTVTPGRATLLQCGGPPHAVHVVHRPEHHAVSIALSIMLSTMP